LAGFSQIRKYDGNEKEGFEAFAEDNYE